MAARSYQADGSLVVDVIDEFCPWNAGCWRVGLDGVERTDEAPALRCDVSALGPAYLGAFTLSQLARTLRVQQLRSGALATADALFRVEKAPWCAEIF